MRLSEISPDELERLVAAGFGGVPLHQFLGLELEALEPDVVVRMEVTRDVGGFVGGVHGGALATMVDVASNCSAGLCDRFVMGETELVTVDLGLKYLRQPRGAFVRAVARRVHEGRQLINVVTEVRDEEGYLVARGDALVTVVGSRGRG